MTMFNLRTDSASPSVKRFATVIGIQSNTDFRSDEKWLMVDFDSYCDRQPVVGLLQQIAQKTGLESAKKFVDVSKPVKKIADRLKTVVRWHGFDSLPVADETGDFYADAVKLADSLPLPESLKLPGSSTCFARATVINAVASDIVAQLATGCELADIERCDKSGLKPLLRNAVQRYGMHALVSRKRAGYSAPWETVTPGWRTDLDDETATAIETVATEIVRDLLPLWFESDTPTETESATVADETATPDDNPFDVETATVKQLKTFLTDNGVEFPKRAKRVELAALAANVK